MAKCCNPVYGDDVFGFVTKTDGIKIHRLSCPNAARLIDRYPYRIQSVKWSENPSTSNFQTTLRVISVLEDYAVNELMEAISSFRASVRKFDMTENSRNGTYDMTVRIAVPSNLELDKVISQIRSCKSIIKVTRI